MKPYSLQSRIDRLKKQLDRCSNSYEHSFTLESIDTKILENIRAQEYYPPDMLLLLEQVGCMRNWGHRGAAMIDWWIPSTLERTLAEDRSSYELLDSNFANPIDLLFFASDCDAKCYLYETKTTPWKIVICDGLDPCIYNEKKKKYSVLIDGWDGKVTPWVESGDALSIIEKWAL